VILEFSIAEMTFEGHSRLATVVQSDRAYATSFGGLYSVVTMSLYRTVSEILQLAT